MPETTAHDLSPLKAKLRALQSFEGVESLARLKPNWDGYGAPAISEAAIDRAMDILWTVRRCVRPRIVPTARGGVQLEWYGVDEEIEVEVLPDGSAEYLLVQVDAGNRQTDEAEGAVRKDSDVLLLVPRGGTP